MLPRLALRPALAVLAAAAVTVLTAATASGTTATPDPDYGPPYQFKAEIMYNNVEPLVNMAAITTTEHGYLYRAGKQNSHLTLIKVTGGVRFADTGTGSFKHLPASCHKRAAAVGVAAVCSIPAWVSDNRPLLIEVWPRLGDDYVDGSTLPASIDMTVLGDEGNDTAKLGAGDDFFNGHLGRDQVWGGAGNDWIRGGDDGDTIFAGAGDDKVVGMDGNDAVYGGEGNDHLYGSAGNDYLQGDLGADLLACSDGGDAALADSSDTVRDCETVNH